MRIQGLEDSIMLCKLLHWGPSYPVDLELKIVMDMESVLQSVAKFQMRDLS